MKDDNKFKIDDVNKIEELEKTMNESWIVNNHNIEVSIIIPSHNRYPLNLFTLYSLEKQNFDMNKMEVIFIDDSSTDDTYLVLKQYTPPFPYCFVKSKENFGRAKTRNIGLSIARGNLIIFLDAEMLVERDFVVNHLQKHLFSNNLVITGALHSQNVYTCIYHDFDEKQLNELRNLSKIDNSLSIKYNYYSKNEKNKESPKKPMSLFNKDEIYKQRYKLLKVSNDYFYSEILERYGEDLQGFNFPWMAFLTGNVSIKKDLLKAVDFFDNEFQRYGYEDWELGYRLHRQGATFVADKAVGGYHQQHPVSDDKWIEAVANYYMFTRKHPDFDVLLLGLELARIVDLQAINEISKEYRYLEEHYSKEFVSFQVGFLRILETIAILLNFDIRHKFLYRASGISKKTKEEILLDIKKMKKTQKFNQIVDLFQNKLA